MAPKLQFKDIVRLDEKQKPTICCLHETHLKYKYTENLKVKELTKEKCKS